MNQCIAAVVGDGFIARDITFRNSTAGAANHQAVALRSGSDLSVFYRCSFEGYQDTLYMHSERQFYIECDVYGTVDFIFGNAAVVSKTGTFMPETLLAKSTQSLLKAEPTRTKTQEFQFTNLGLQFLLKAL